MVWQRKTRSERRWYKWLDSFFFLFSLNPAFLTFWRKGHESDTFIIGDQVSSWRRGIEKKAQEASDAFSFAHSLLTFFVSRERVKKERRVYCVEGNYRSPDSERCMLPELFLSIRFQSHLKRDEARPGARNSGKWKREPDICMMCGIFDHRFWFIHCTNMFHATVLLVVLRFDLRDRICPTN